MYLKEAKRAGCKNCQKLWQDMKKRYEDIEKMLMAEIKKHVSLGIFGK